MAPEGQLVLAPGDARDGGRHDALRGVVEEERGERGGAWLMAGFLRRWK